MQLLRSLLFSTGMIVSTLIFAILCVLLAPAPYFFRYRFTTLWNRFNLWWLKFTCRIDFEINGLENIPPGPAIIFCKHQSTWETIALPTIFPPQVWVLKRELLWVPFFGWGLALLKPIAINRKAGRKAINQILHQGLARLHAGLWVVFFPEGTRVAPGKQVRYKMGGALLAEHTRYPVVPVAHNAGEFWGRRQFVKTPGTIRISIGPAIDTTDLSANEINTRAQQWIEDTLSQYNRQA